MAGRFLFSAGLLVAVIALSCGVESIRLEPFKGDVTAAAAQSLLHAKDRRLAGDPSSSEEDAVCYEGCLLPPVDDPSAAPLPQLLLGSTTPVALLDCYNAAVQAGLSNFAIFNVTSCYGGSTAVLGWALDGEGCPIECKENGTAPYICGGVNKASVFSVGYCPRLNVPCPPPSSSPPPPPPVFTCRDNTSLYGVDLSKIHLSSKKSAAANIEECRGYCLADPRCQGFFYKTTNYCYLMSQVSGFKQYGTSVKACRL
ncbi:hypothetical protein VOLCADRAFT_105269 [Volvox carteri f. nagariensis]|uniref:Apple domain-containing protein n=1 Tax=Volvox carteri f. nagariensis TaxID=3068 RepID=D8TZP2_VOLCA|nr:uncharacterized protein VOLCADRAFT_105269 [Volvox carteri f. nagariensis]EFJ46958.1 hypothetical protein VOLCADRAFT_105269 [Volvox carteri f. nagariensis]|eukprot:XP_002951853.1 hypothetical protein VOLCADRAFT_105269 [Volvox carteri f. nagariensis]